MSSASAARVSHHFFSILVRIGVAADVDRFVDVAALAQFASKDLFEIGLGEQLGLEVEAGREVEVAVRRAGVAVEAPALYDDLENVHFPAKKFIRLRSPISRRESPPTKVSIALCLCATGVPDWGVEAHIDSNVCFRGCLVDLFFAFFVVDEHFYDRYQVLLI